jgi:SAM-dependent methyltransferase
MESLKKGLQNLFRFLYVLRGRRPWTIGYTAYRKKGIQTVLQRGYFNGAKLPLGYGYRMDERIIEYPWFFSRLPDEKGTLLDAGSVLNFDFILSQQTLKTKKIFISTLAPEPHCFWKKGISYIFEDLRETCYRDGYFDWIVSLSTLEHVGLDNTFLYTDDMRYEENIPDAYLVAAKEYRRILKPGGVLYVSLPFGRHRNHGWFQVFDASMVDHLIDVFSPSELYETHFRYEPEGWQTSSREQSKDATCFDASVQKSLDRDYAAFSRAIVCLEMVK